MRDSRRKPYLALDFGAQSGRALLAHLQAGILTTEEVHRFANEPVEYGGSLHWDVPRLWFEVRNALSRLGEVELAGIGVDAWGVDYALLGERGELLQNPYHYRDRRTEGIMEEVLGRVTKKEIYEATGIQFMPINTLYQLFAARRQTPELLKAAKCLLTIPDLFNYWLTGKAVCEFTNATTTQMVDPVKRAWAAGLMQRLELPAHLPAPMVEPGSIIGTLLPDIAGHSCLAGTTVIAPACHDTGSAVAAISAREGTAFLSSGTWSLLGTELDSPVITPDALRMNFTNEGGVNGTTRLLKNVMGLWMLQGCRQAWTRAGPIRYGYRELIEMAAREYIVSVTLSIPMTSPSCARRICSWPSISSAPGLISQFRGDPAHMYEAFSKASRSSIVLFSGIWNTCVETTLSKFGSSAADRRIDC